MYSGTLGGSNVNGVTVVVVLYNVNTKKKAGQEKKTAFVYTMS